MDSRPTFDSGELEVKGYYDSAVPVPGPPILNSPISTAQNTLLALNGKKPYWFPSVGMIGGDYKPFRPARSFPDMWVAHDFMAGGNPVDWASVPDIQTGWFGVQWKYDPVAGGAMPVPGSQLIHNMNEWEKLPWPDLDEIDWEESVEENREYLRSDLPIECCIPTLYWERLMSILEVVDAAIALIDPNQKEAVKAFFEKLTEFYIDYLKRIKKYYNPDIILAHDDWGHQNGQFFSNETHDELILPYFKRFVQEVHALGMRFELHCCGKAEGFVPEMIDAGVDLWVPQEMNDTKGLVEQYKDQGITFGVYLPPAPQGTPDETLWEIAESFVNEYGNGPAAYVDYTRNPDLYAHIYELSRKKLL